MRCPTRGEPPHVLTQLCVLLLWILHIVTCQQQPPLTASSASGPGSSVTVHPTRVTIGSSATPRAAERRVGSGGSRGQDGGAASGHGGEVVVDGRRSVTDTGSVRSTTAHVLVPPSDILLLPSEGATTLSPSSSFTTSSSPTSSLPQLSPTSASTERTAPVLTSTPSLSSSSLTFTTASDIIYNSQLFEILPSSTAPGPGWSSRDDDDTTPLSSLGVTSVADIPASSVTTTLLQGGREGTGITTPAVVIGVTSTSSHTNGTMEVSHTNPPHNAATPALTHNTTRGIVHVDVTVTAGEGRDVTFTDVTPGGEMWNQTSVLPPGGSEEDEGLSVGATVGISVACILVIVSGVLVGLGILYHRHRSRKLDTTKTQTNLYTGLWDDNVTLSYINNHFDFFQKDAQDEMISLDNDAYLNSLEFMVFTNTWGDGKRNTRF